LEKSGFGRIKPNKSKHFCLDLFGWAWFGLGGFSALAWENQIGVSGAGDAQSALSEDRDATGRPPNGQGGNPK
jgi:hypothetical protein